MVCRRKGCCWFIIVNPGLPRRPTKCYIKNNDEHLGKYDDRDCEGIFLGYAANSKGYNCYNKSLHKLVDCIDIKIDEGILVKDIQISSVEQDTEDTAEFKEERVQASEKEDPELYYESANN